MPRLRRARTPRTRGIPLNGAQNRTPAARMQACHAARPHGAGRVLARAPARTPRAAGRPLRRIRAQAWQQALAALRFREVRRRRESRPHFAKPGPRAGARLEAPPPHTRTTHFAKPSPPRHRPRAAPGGNPQACPTSRNRGPVPRSCSEATTPPHACPTSPNRGPHPRGVAAFRDAGLGSCRGRAEPHRSRWVLAAATPLSMAPTMPTRPWSVPQRKRLAREVVPSYRFEGEP